MAIRDIQDSSAASDFVAVFDVGLNQLFPNALKMRVEARPTAELVEHPLETGTLVVDHIIYNPIQLDLFVMLSTEDYRAAYQKIRQVYFSAEGPLSVQTRADTFDNMYIQGIPHEERTEHYDAVSMTIRLKQVRVEGTIAVFEPEQDIDNTTEDGGEKNPEESPNQSLLSRIIS